MNSGQSWTAIIRIRLILAVLWWMMSSGTVQGQSTEPVHLPEWNQIPTELLTTDSAVQAVKEMEGQLLESGDTIQAFAHYVRWMAAQIDWGNQQMFGQEFEPYVAFAQNHPEVADHYLYEYLYGLHLSSKGKHIESLRLMLDAENDIEAHHQEFLENLYFEVTNSFIKLTDFGGATDYALKNLEFNLQEGSKSGELSARLLIATCFAKQNRFEEANRQRARAIDLARETGEYGQIIFIMANNAIDERKQKNLDKAFEFYDAALTTIDTNTTFNDSSLRYFRAFVHGNKLTLFNDAGMTDSVIVLGPVYLDSLIAYEAHQSIIDTKIQIGRAYLLNGHPTKALEYLEEARDDLEGSGYEDFIIKVNKYLAQAYQQIGDFTQATAALNTQIQTQTRLDSVNNEQLINSLQMRYESDRQQQLIEKTEAQVLEEQQQRRTSVRILTGSLIGLVLISFSVFQWRHRLQLKREKDLEVQFNQKLIQYQENENSRISKELHDGIGQSLMLIKNKVQLQHDEQTAQMIGDTLNEVRSISRALHPFTLQKLGLTAALEKLIHDYDENSDTLVDAHIEPIDDHFSEKAALNIFRIVQEVLNNIMKHAQAKSVEFTVLDKKKFAQIDIQDNGVGFDVTENFNTVESLGLKTLRERTRFLKGQMHIDSEKGKGTHVLLKIPYDV